MSAGQRLPSTLEPMHFRPGAGLTIVVTRGENQTNPSAGVEVLGNTESVLAPPIVR